MSGIVEGDLVLDVATGTGFMARAVADTGAEVIATDFTPAMLQRTAELLDGVERYSLALADADHLPFARGVFDVVTCRVSVHHFAHPPVAIGEMARVCRAGGRVVIMDVISSEDEPRSELQNRLGKMRDGSEVRQWRLSELEAMVRQAGLTILGTERSPHPMAFSEWISLGQTAPETESILREMMIDSMDGDKAGLSPFFEGDDLFFIWTTGIIVARK